MSTIGLSRLFVAAQQLRRFGREADIDFGARHANSAATLSVSFTTSLQRRDVLGHIS